MLAFDWGSVADWLSALGGLGSLGAAWYVAFSQRRQKMLAEEQADQLVTAHRSEIIERAITLLNSALDRLYLYANEAPYWSEEGTGEARLKRDFDTIAAQLRALKDWQVVSPSISFDLDLAANACEIRDYSNAPRVHASNELSRKQAEIKAACKNLSRYK